MNVEIDEDLLTALYERLLCPTKDIEGQTVYQINVNLALDLRKAIKSVVVVK